MNKKILMICPYFGKIPPYFQLWALSAGYNSNITFLVMCDFEVPGRLPPNVKVVAMRFEEVKKRIQTMFGKAKINHPYKLCDYKPAYGEIFSDYCEFVCGGGYDFWGYCDFDLIFGNISNFLTEDILNKVDKCYRHGHFTLYRNDPVVNAVYRKEVPGYASYRDAFSTNYNTHFDESSFMATDQYTGLNSYFQYDFYDIPYNHSNFEYVPCCSNYTNVIKWENGKLTVFSERDGDIIERPVLYVHMQKRAMTIQTLDYKKGFLIVPNAFVDISPVTLSFLKSVTLPENVLYYKRKRIYNAAKNVVSGGLIWRLHRFKVDDYLK